MTTADLRLGRWQDTLADVECDALITDPPYSARTHKGQRTTDKPLGEHKHYRAALPYDALTVDGVEEIVAHFAPRTKGWMVCFTSHDLVREYADAMERLGRYVFAPLPWLNEGGPIRLSGDGPSSWTCWIVVSRPKTRAMQGWGTLPGGYHNDSRADPAMSNKSGIIGGKPLGLMRAIIRDYSRPGDLICDPFAGGGTTLIAALIEGRSAIGSEMDPKTHALATARIKQGHTPNMFSNTEG